jgi:hypothetical protein
MSTTIRTREPRELLALVPFQLGFVPQDSAVVLSVRAERSRIGLVARVDLPDLADPAQGAQVARALIGHLVADGACRAVVVLYTSVDLQAPQVPGRRTRSVATRAIDHLQDAAEHALGHLECWVVGPTGYYAFGCDDRDCCPTGGRPLTELESTRVGAQMVLEGVQVARSRSDLVHIAPVDAAVRKSARRSAARWRSRGLAATGSAELHRWRREGLVLWRTAFDEAYRASDDSGAVVRSAGETGPDGLPGTPEAGRAGSGQAEPARPAASEDGVVPVRFGPSLWAPPGPAVVGRLLTALEDAFVRDAVMLGFTGDADLAADLLVAGDTAGVGDALRVIIDPVHGRRPDQRRTAAARAVLEHLVAHVGREGHAPALTLLAVLAWWEGDGARAGVLTDLALGADPDHRLALLLDQALRTGMPPGWVRAASA